MAKIIFALPDKTKTKVQIGIGEENDFTVLTVKFATYTALGSPARGGEISDEALDIISFDDEVFRALKKAVSIIAVADKSKNELKIRLTEAGYSNDAVSAAVDECVRLGYIDEMRQLERLIEKEANRKLKGRYYIRHRLIAKGYDAEDIDRAFDLLTERGEVDFDANFAKLTEKRGEDDERRVRALKYRYGYEDDISE